MTIPARLRGPARLVAGLVAALTLAAPIALLGPSWATAAPLEPVVVAGMNLDSGGTAVINELEQSEVAPGLTHVKYERLDDDGWQQINILKAELGDDTVRAGYLSPTTVSGSGATVSEMVDDAGAVAGVNLDHFDINNSTASAGWGIQDGEIVKSGNPDSSASIVFDSDGIGRLMNLALQGSADFAGGSVPITGINVYQIDSGVALFNARWGDYSRTRAIGGAAGVEVQVGADGTVISVAEGVGAGRLPDGVQALVTRADAPEAAALRSLKPGDPVTISYRVDSGTVDAQEAGGAWHRLLTDGAVVDHQDPALHPRTMIGLSKDGRTAYFVELDGRSAIARGMTMKEQGQLLKDLGAWNGMNADGGGSSQMNVREPGDETSTVMNTPSDGGERRDGDGMGLFLARPGSGRLTGFVVEPTIADEDGIRVFPGLTRRLVAKGHDEGNAAVDGEPTSWSVGEKTVATVADGSVTGVAPGTTTVTARSGKAGGEAEVTVLGGLDHLVASHRTVGLPSVGDVAQVQVTGADAAGFGAPLEPGDVTVTNSAPDGVAVEPTGNGSWQVSALADQVSAVIGFEAQGKKVEVATAVGLTAHTLADFADADKWSAANDRAPGVAVTSGAGHDDRASLAVTYDFTQNTATRGAYAVAPDGGIAIPGQPQKLALWVKGDGNGAWLRLQVRDADGLAKQLDGPTITWTGWQRVEVTVPETSAFPLKLERIRAMETAAAKQYTGTLEYAGVEALVPPELELPAAATVEDPVITTAGATDGSPLRVAVMSDSQFTAANPDSANVAGARRTLRQITAADPDVLLIAGDFVDEAHPDDFALARQILTEELAGADFPWYYTPGNHELMGGPIDNFIAEFGDTSRHLDVDGTRIVLVSSATGKLMTDFDQVQMIREQLDSAADDPSITGVLVVTHMPPEDPSGTGASQLADRNEADMVKDWLQEFRAESGKSAAYVAGHVGVFHAGSEDGVPVVINGNSGKSPSAPADEGGFVGWTMLGIEPAQGQWGKATGPWLQAETRPWVEEGLAISGPDALKAGDSAEISAVFSQDGRTVPVDWPVSGRWSGRGVWVGSVDDAPAGTVVAVDPDAGTATGVGAGSAEVTITVNGESVTRAIAVTGGPSPSVSATPSTSATPSASAGASVPADPSVTPPAAPPTGGPDGEGPGGEGPDGERTDRGRLSDTGGPGSGLFAVAVLLTIIGAVVARRERV